MLDYIITTSMAGAYLPEGDSAIPFAATPGEAIDALVDEAAFQLGDVFDDDDDTGMSDAALIEALRGGEGRGDLLYTLTTRGEASIRLESMFNWFGGDVRVTRMDLLA